MSAGEIAGWLMLGHLVLGSCWLVHLARHDPSASAQRRSYLGAWVSPLGNDRVLIAAGLGVATVVHLPANPPQRIALEPGAEEGEIDQPVPSAPVPADAFPVLELLWTIPSPIRIDEHPLTTDTKPAADATTEKRPNVSAGARSHEIPL